MPRTFALAVPMPAWIPSAMSKSGRPKFKLSHQQDKSDLALAPMLLTQRCQQPGAQGTIGAAIILVSNRLRFAWLTSRGCGSLDLAVPFFAWPVKPREVALVSEQVASSVPSGLRRLPQAS